MAAVKKPLSKYVRTPAQEAELPDRVTMFGGTKSRVKPLGRVALGFNIATKDKPDGEYLERLGFKDWKLGSTSRVASIKNAENKYLTDMMPLIVGVIKDMEVKLRKKYRDSAEDSEIKRTETENSYVTKKLRPIVTAQFAAKKTAIAKPGGLGGATPYVRAMLEYRRITPDLRTRATLEFRERKRKDSDGKMITRSPDATSARDLKELVIIAKELRKAIN